ncbi:MAG: acyltransferase [Clostridia bacterium]|nr:acyltransferase [Clostridia bacterium]
MLLCGGDPSYVHPLSQLAPDSLAYVLIFAANNVLCFSVPAFIFLSGFKLYSGYGGRKINLGKFYLRRVTKIVIPYVIAVLVFFVYFYAKKWVAASALPEYIFLGTLVAHFYYVVIAVQLYALFPLIKWLFNKSPIALTAVSLVCTVCFQQFFPFTYSDRFFASYVFYFILGMVFAKYRAAEKTNKIFLTCLPLCFGASLVRLTLSYLSATWRCAYPYANLFNMVYVTLAIMVIYGVCVMAGEEFTKLHNYARGFGEVSYNVYLYHILLMNVLQYECSRIIMTLR